MKEVLRSVQAEVSESDVTEDVTTTDDSTATAAAKSITDDSTTAAADDYDMIAAADPMEQEDNDDGRVSAMALSGEGKIGRVRRIRVIRCYIKIKCDYSEFAAGFMIHLVSGLTSGLRLDSLKTFDSQQRFLFPPSQQRVEKSTR